MSQLTWDDIAGLYKAKTGRTAKVLPMDEVYEWAAQRDEIVVNEDTSLSWAGIGGDSNGDR